MSFLNRKDSELAEDILQTRIQILRRNIEYMKNCQQVNQSEARLLQSKINAHIEFHEYMLNYVRFYEKLAPTLLRDYFALARNLEKEIHRLDPDWPLLD